MAEAKAENAGFQGVAQEDLPTTPVCPTNMYAYCGVGLERKKMIFDTAGNPVGYTVDDMPSRGVTPAQYGNIHPGDIITAINTEDGTGFQPIRQELDHLKLLGIPGSTVGVQVRDKDGGIRTVELLRDVILPPEPPAYCSRVEKSLIRIQYDKDCKVPFSELTPDSTPATGSPAPKKRLG